MSTFKGCFGGLINSQLLPNHFYFNNGSRFRNEVFYDSVVWGALGFKRVMRLSIGRCLDTYFSAIYHCSATWSSSFSSHAEIRNVWCPDFLHSCLVCCLFWLIPVLSLISSDVNRLTIKEIFLPQEIFPLVDLIISFRFSINIIN